MNNFIHFSDVSSVSVSSNTENGYPNDMDAVAVEHSLIPASDKVFALKLI